MFPVPIKSGHPLSLEGLSVERLVDAPRSESSFKHIATRPLQDSMRRRFTNIVHVTFTEWPSADFKVTIRGYLPYVA